MKNIIIDKKKAFPRTFKGWGTSLCWWANRIGYSEKMVSDSASLFFSTDGLGLNIMRYNIGGGDDPPHNHITRTDSDMPGWLKKDQNGELYYDHNADEYQLNILKAAYEAAGEDAYVEAFSNSPPYFMTVSGCSSGSKNAISNNLKKSCVTDFAEYLAYVCRYINNELGIKISSLAAMNEPFTNYWKAYSPKQEGCHVSPGKMQSLVICEAARAMKNSGLESVDITASDETNTTLQNIACKRLSKEAWDCIDRISTHTYSKATPKVAKTAAQMGKPIWMTETDWSGIEGDDAGEMGAALWLGMKIVEDLNTLEADAWVIWQIVAGYISKNEYKGKKDMPCLPDLNEGYWGVAFADTDKEEIILTQKYYAFGQFSRFIRPGMSLIKVDRETLACYDEENEKLYAVCLNRSKQEAVCTLSLKGFTCENGSISAVRTCGSGKNKECWAVIDAPSLENGSVSFTLRGNSITTFIISNVKGE